MSEALRLDQLLGVWFGEQNGSSFGHGEQRRTQEHAMSHTGCNIASTALVLGHVVTGDGFHGALAFGSERDLTAHPGLEWRHLVYAYAAFLFILSLASLTLCQFTTKGETT